MVEGMRACGVRRFGSDVVLLDLAEPPVPGPQQLVLAMDAAGLGGWDPLVGTGQWDVGLHPPAALGVEGAGRVVAVGEGATDVAVGDAVLTHEAPLPGGSGLWTERALLTVAHVAPLPAGLDPVAAAALPVSGLTARQALDDVALESGQRLLVTGGASPTGSLVIQLAVSSGVSVTTTASPRHAARLAALGAEVVLDYRDSEWPKKTTTPFDAAVVAAPETSNTALGLIADGGRLCSLVSDAPEGERGIDSKDLYVRPDRSQLAALARLMHDGLLVIDVEAVALADGPRVFDVVSRGGAAGKKYVIRP
jgi:NADPH:quinone reductase-like Zn-dependent oxidoreductase